MTRAFLLGFSLVAASLGAGAMSFHADPPYLYLASRVVKTDWEAWQEAMERFDGKIKAIVFDNSPGGDSVTGRRIGHDIRKRGLMTVVSGRCASACANMFLGGKERLFSARLNEQPTVLGYHGSYNKKTHQLSKNRPPDYFVEMSEGKMDEDFVGTFTSIENRKGLLYFVHEAQQRDGGPLAYLCKGDENPKHRDEECENLKGVDALSKGIVTSWDVAKVPFPPKPWPTKGTAKNWD
ncbi:hypothetical protein BWI17_19620 [Betaproteobacteria bacterium GR16-43]|nr:hypothetical protein BWI17_19620 [Betaproteobacteria bacterium GR16-43]